MREAVWIVAAALALAGCAKEGSEKVSAPAPAPVAAPAPAPGTFGAIESEILVPKCATLPGCHDGSAPAAGLDLSGGAAYSDLVGVKATRRPERRRVAAGDPEGSYLLDRLVSGGDTPTMPLGGPPLSAAEIEAIRAWIRDGAKR